MVNHVENESIVGFRFWSKYTGFAKAVVTQEFGSSTPIGRKRRIGHHSVELRITKGISFQRVTVLDVKVVIFYAVQQHIHTSQVECGGILFLSIDTVRFTITSSTKQQRPRTTCGVIYVFKSCLSSRNNLGQNEAHFLWGVKLASFLSSASGKLADHILVSITKDVNIAGLFQTKVNAIESHQHIADELIFVVGGFTQFRRSKVNVGEKTAEVVLALLSNGAVFNSLQRAFQLRQDILLVPNSLNDCGEEEIGLNEITKILNT